MKKHVLQWHITHKCNLRCSHCYQDDYSKELSLSQAENIFEQYLSYLKAKDYTGHINITGGEPLVYPYLFEVLDLFEKNNMRFGLLTNGLLLDDQIVLRLSQYKNLHFVQLSLDGVKETHERIRGTHTFDKTLAAAHLLKKYHITSMVSFTAHKGNYKELKDVIKTVKRHKIDRFFTDRLIPIETDEEIMSTDEFYEYVKVLTSEAKKAKKSPFTRTQIHTHRALQFCTGDSHQIYYCSAGVQLLTILANGDLVPCRRMPVVLGNVLKEPMLDLCEKSDFIKEITKIPTECYKCYKAHYCKGGLRCLTYAVTGDLSKRDINCRFEELW